MKKINYIFGSCVVILLFWSWTLRQSENPESEFRIPFKGRFFTTDNLGNLFTVGKDNSITKYDQKGTVKARVNFKVYGNLTQLDVSNPFEIYAYYRDQQTILVLDNLLSQLNSIPLNQISTGEITAACRSYDNGIWYYDAGITKIYKRDKSLELKQEGMPISSWTDKIWNPTQMLDNDKHLFVNDSANGIAVFDIFSNYSKTINLKGLIDFQIKKQQIFFFKDNYFQSYDFKFLRTDTLYRSPNSKMVRLDAGNLYVWQRDSLKIKPYKKL